MKKTILTVFVAISILYLTSCSSDDSGNSSQESLIVDIPDANFKKLLVNNIEINTNGDEEIQKTEAAAYNGIINSIVGTGRDIKSIKGIEEFINITQIYLDGYAIESVDLTKNTALHSLEITNSLLTSIDVSMNTKLVVLNLEKNQLTSIDISNNTELVELYLDDNNLTALDISNNPLLDELTLSDNQLTTIDISSNINLEHLNLNNNKLTSIDVSSNTNLKNLHLSKNQLSTINVSKNSKLIRLNISENDLRSAFVNNGNNNNITLFNFTNNRFLYCITVDTPLPTNLNTSKWKTDSASVAIFATDCTD